VAAKVQLVQHGTRADSIGGFSRESHMSPYYRSSATFGFW
jgi:hypothetical protein